MDERKKFRLADVILSVICVVFVAEAAAPVASIGNSQYFWWLFMMVAFLLPYGMISSELGTAYPGDGGLYDWIHKAFPETKWGARASWYYWINFPLWMASLAVVCPELLGVLTGLRFGWGARLLIELAFIWVITWIACYPVCDSILILNISAAIKMLLALTVGVLGIVYVARSGFVNDMAPRTFLPGFDLHSLSYISVIIFNFLGFEVVCTYADNMRDPKRQIPQAIVSGGIVIALIYLFSAFGIGAAIPTQEISEDSGLIDAVALMTGRTSGWFVGAVALLFLITLFGNMISWSMGVNATAAYAAARRYARGLFPPLGEKRYARRRGAHERRRCERGVHPRRGHRAAVSRVVAVLELFRAQPRHAAAELCAGVSGVFAPACARPGCRAAVSRAGRARGAARAGLCAHGADPHLDLFSRPCRCPWTAKRSRTTCRSRSARSSASPSARCSSRRVRAAVLRRGYYGKTNHRLDAQARRLPDARGIRAAVRRVDALAGAQRQLARRCQAPHSGRFWTWRRPSCSLNP